MRDQWLHAVRSRLADDAGPYAALEDSALVEAAELVTSTTRARDLPETCYVVGLLHWRRVATLADERATNEIRLVIPLFMLVHGSGAALPLPETLVDALSTAPDFSTAPPDELWDWVILVLEPWMTSNADPHFLELAVRFARNAVADTGHRDPRRASRVSFLKVAAQHLAMTPPPRSPASAQRGGRACVGQQ